MRCPLSAPPLSYHTCFHLRFGCPLLVFPGMSTSSILLTMCPSFILLTRPYHFSRFSVIFSDACTTLVVPLMCSYQILSLLDTPHIHLCILISFISSRSSCRPLVVAQVSATRGKEASRYVCKKAQRRSYFLCCLKNPSRFLSQYYQKYINAKSVLGSNVHIDSDYILSRFGSYFNVFTVFWLLTLLVRFN